VTSWDVTWDEAIARRLARHGLTAPLDGPVAAVRAICGAHAQVASAGEVSVALRLAESSREAVRSAIWDTRELVRTYGPRGTVHLLPADDLPMWTGALGAIPAGQGGLPEELRYTEAQTDELIAAMADALVDAELVAEELTGELVDRVGRWAAEPRTEQFQQSVPRWRTVLHLAAHRGAICFGPNRGRRVTYTNPARWLPGFAPADGDAAMAALILRFLHAYGPATPAWFARWVGCPIGWARTRFAALGDRIAPVTFEEVDAWVVGDDLDVGGDDAGRAGDGRRVHLLPYFDAFGIGTFPRERLFPGPAWDRALAGGQAGNYPLLLIDGEVAGVWHQRRSGRLLDITVEPLSRLSSARRRDLEVEVERLATIQDANPRLTVGEISVGPHA
jgi:hypothetical protein